MIIRILTVTWLAFCSISFMQGMKREKNIRKTATSFGIIERIAGDILEGNEEVACQCLKECSIDVNKAFRLGNMGPYTFLFLAAGHNRVKLVRFLLHEGADPNIRCINGYTPLIVAILQGSAPLVKLLLTANTDIKMKYKETEDTALMCAVEQGNEEIVRLLLEAKACLESKNVQGQTALTHAVYDGRKALVAMLIEAGADINCQCEDAQGIKGYTPLMIAVIKGHENIVEFLLASGALVETRNQYGHTALDCALKQKEKRENIIKLLLDSPRYRQAAPIITLSVSGVGIVRIPLLEAIKADCVLDGTQGESSLNMTSDILARITKQKNPDLARLIHAIGKRDNVKVQTLLSQGISVNDRAFYGGITALMVAAMVGDATIIRLMLSQGADPKLKDDCNMTALEYAANGQHKEVAAMLMEYSEGENGSDQVVLQEKIYAGEAAVIQPQELAKVPVEHILAVLRNEIQLANIINNQLENCNTCDKPAVKRCARCNMVRYCSQVCQKDDWQKHKELCGKIHIFNLISQHKDGLATKGAELLTLAVKQNFAAAVKALIQLGVDVNVPDNQGQTALALAKKNGNTEIVELLRQAGATA